LGSLPFQPLDHPLPAPRSTPFRPAPKLKENMHWMHCQKFNCSAKKPLDVFLLQINLILGDSFKVQIYIKLKKAFTFFPPPPCPFPTNKKTR